MVGVEAVEERDQHAGIHEHAGVRLGRRGAA